MPKDRWEWAYLGIYVLMVGLLLTILILAYWPVAQCQADKPPVTTEAEESAKDENRQGSVGIRITMTGIGGDADAYAQHDPAGIAITMTGEEKDGNGARASATLVARTGSSDGGEVAQGAADSYGSIRSVRVGGERMKSRSVCRG